MADVKYDALNVAPGATALVNTLPPNRRIRAATTRSWLCQLLELAHWAKAGGSSDCRLSNRVMKSMHDGNGTPGPDSHLAEAIHGSRRGLSKFYEGCIFAARRLVSGEFAEETARCDRADEWTSASFGTWLG